MDREVVIKIPEQIYDMVVNTGTFGCYRFNTTKAIKNGTPLPKGHGKLIDADELWDLYHSNDYDFYEALYSARTIVEAEKGAEK